MAIHEESEEQASLMARSRRIGGVVFLIGGALQMLVMAIMAVTLLWVEYEYGFSGRVHYEDSYTEFMTANKSIVNLAIACSAAALAYVALGWPFGRIAGKLIVSKRVPYGLVGAFAYFVPAFLATIVGINAISLYLTNSLFFKWVDFEHDVLEPSGVFFLMLYLPGIVVGILSALFTHQICKPKSIKAS